MNRNRNAVNLGLMLTSVVLLVLLEALWLYRSYEKEAFEFRREVSFLLRNTIGEMRDSLLMERVQWLPGDSVRVAARHIFSRDSLPLITRHERSVHYDTGVTSSKSTVKVFLSTPSDSLQSEILKTVIRRAGDPSRGRSDRAFVIQVRDDSLSTTDVAKRYTDVLLGRHLPSPKQIHMSKELRSEVPLDVLQKRFRETRSTLPQERHPNLFSSEMRTESVPYSPAFHYYASFAGVHLYLIRQIAPELLFALFVTALTCGAFVLVYGSLKRQQRLVELKDTFISNITHELKTPVATVGVALEAMRNFSAMDKPQLTRDYLDIAMKEVNRLAAMTDNILNTSVLEAGNNDIKKDPVNLQTLFQEVIASMNVLASGRGASIAYETEGDDFVITGDAALLANMLSNLLDNAIKYSDKEARVLVSLGSSGRALTLRVKDNGPGIDPAFHNQIYDKFFRVPKGDVHTVKGYGLGLNYVRSVVRLHHGTIDLDSSREKGTEFIIKFPLSVQRSR